MMFLKQRFLLFAIIIHFVSLSLGAFQEFVLPTEINVFSNRNVEAETRTVNERRPSTPQKCPENMALFRISASEKICDCIPKFLYFSENDTCYEAYRQGPCGVGKYVILSNDTVQCMENPCKVDGQVLFKNECSTLGSSKPCENDAILEISRIYTRPECSDLIIPFLIVDSPQKECPAGSRRNYKGVCKKIL